MNNSEFEALSAAEQSERLQRLGQIALESWEDDWSIVRLIKYRENAVFEAAAKNGGRAVLRIHRNGYHDDSALRSELMWMDALGQSGVAVPLLVRTRDGEPFTKVGAAEVPDIRQVDMFRWIDARPVADCDESANLKSIYFEAGRLAAAMHRHGENWVQPDEFTRLHWDSAGLIGSNALWGDFRKLGALTSDQLALLDSASQAAEAELAGIEGQRYGLIHADFVPDNLLYGAEGLRVIDFDDCGFGWYMFELATALFFHLDEPHYQTVETSLLEGYRSLTPLPAADWGRLPLFLFVRSLTYLGWMNSRPETETAREQTGPMIALSIRLANAYLASKA